MSRQTSSAVHFSEPFKGWSDGAIRQRVLVSLSVFLAFVILALGLWTALSTAQTVYSSYSPVIYMDHWQMIQELQQASGKVSLPLLWAQHNEHRIVIGRLSLFADMRFFGARGISMLIEIYLVQLCLVILLTWLCRYFGHFRGVVLITVAGFFTYCLFSPLQIESFYINLQITYIFAGFSAALAFACVVWHAAKVAEGKATWVSWPLALAFVAAFLSECSLSYGVLAWPIIFLLCFSLRLGKRTLALSGAVGLAATGLYLIGYHSPPWHTNPWTSIRHPFSIAKFVVTYFAACWDASLPSFSYWPTVSESLTVLAIAFVLGIAVWRLLVRQSAPDLLLAFLVSNLILNVLTAVLTSLGRLSFGLAQATSSRYQGIALLFWASLAAVIVRLITNGRSHNFALIGLQIVLIILMAGSAGRFGALELEANQRPASLATAYSALAYDPPDLEALKILYPAPQLLPAWYAYVRAHNLGPDATEFLTRPRLDLKTVPNWGGYQVVAMSNCAGFLDAVKRIAPNRVTTLGWAWDIAAKRAPKKIVFALPGGLLVGFGETDAPRPDVRAVLNIQELVTGWDGEALAARGSQLQAFAVLADSKSICPLSNPMTAP